MPGTVNIIDTSALSTAAKQDVEHADLVAILAKLSADPATQTTLAAVLAKLITAPSTEAKQDVGNAVLANILAKLIAAPATEAKQDTGNTSLSSLAAAVGAPDATLPASVVQEGGVASATAPSAVTSGRAVRAWRSLTGAAVSLLIGKDGAAPASVTNAVPVTPETASTWKTDGSGVTQPVSGSVTATISGTPAVTVSSGAITETNSGTIATNTGTLAGAVDSGAVVVKGGGTAGTAASAVVTVQGIASMTPVQIGDNSGSLTVDAPVATPVFVRLSDGASAVAPALAAQLPSALGQAASASSLTVTQSTEDAAKVPSLGQALAAASVPVVLTAIQIAQLVQTGQLPASLGTLASSASMSVVRSVASIDQQTTLATAGKVIKASPGICYGLTSYYNNTGGAIFFQIFNTTSAPTAGDRPAYFSASIANGTKSSLGFGITALGLGCSTGITFAVSSTQDTFTAIASTAVIYALQYD